jgi:hypothetical protein
VKTDRTEEIEHWVRMLLLRAGIRLVNFSKASDIGPPPPMGLINVPGKYVSIIDAMHQAIVAAANGEKLPEFVPLPPAKTGPRRKR